MQFYYDGRRQLQPLVRLRSDIRRSDPALERNYRSTHHARPCTAAVTPGGTMLGFIDGHRPRQPTRPSLETSIEAVELARRMPQPAGTLTRWGSQQNVVADGLHAQPNGVRLSCAAVLCLSQMQFYHDGRRQLQPLVRPHASEADPARTRSLPAR